MVVPEEGDRCPPLVHTSVGSSSRRRVLGGVKLGGEDHVPGLTIRELEGCAVHASSMR